MQCENQLTGIKSVQEYSAQHRERSRLLQLLVESEVSRLGVWSNPLSESSTNSARTVANAGSGLEKSVSHVSLAFSVLRIETQG